MAISYFTCFLDLALLLLPFLRLQNLGKRKRVSSKLLLYGPKTRRKEGTTVGSRGGGEQHKQKEWGLRSMAIPPFLLSPPLPAVGKEKVFLPTLLHHFSPSSSFFPSAVTFNFPSFFP